MRQKGAFRWIAACHNRFNGCELTPGEPRWEMTSGIDSMDVTYSRHFSENCPNNQEAFYDQSPHSPLRLKTIGAILSGVVVFHTCGRRRGDLAHSRTAKKPNSVSFFARNLAQINGENEASPFGLSQGGLPVPPVPDQVPTHPTRKISAPQLPTSKKYITHITYLRKSDIAFS